MNFLKIDEKALNNSKKLMIYPIYQLYLLNIFNLNAKKM